MKQLLLIPKRLHPSRYDFLNVKGEKCLDFHCLYEMIQNKLGFEIIYTDEIGPFSSDTEAILCIFRRPMILRGEINPRIKFIITLGDVHNSHKDWICKSMPILKRANIILNGSNDAFRQAFPQFVKKYIFFPQFFRTHERYVSLGYNKNPMMKCLLTGRVQHKYYALRTWLWEKVAFNEDNGEWRKRIDIMKHYWYERKRTKIHSWEIPPAVGDEYARMLHKYFCGTALEGEKNYMNAKCVEIPAAGSLLLTNETPDMITAGFIPMKHYVSVTKTTSLPQIEDCLVHPEKYEKIKREGMEFVRTNHSINNRFEQIKKILEGFYT